MAAQQHQTNYRQNKKNTPPIIISDHQTLLSYGVAIAKIPTDTINISKWATELSQTTLANATFESDNEYAFYRNILDEPHFPFESILSPSSDIATVVKKHFGIGNLDKELKLDDAFCIRYDTSQDDTTCAKHTDPSDITVNMCLDMDGVVGSEVLFYGRKRLYFDNSSSSDELLLRQHNNTSKNDGNRSNDNDHDDDDDDQFSFLVEQKKGYATVHWGSHPHQTLPLRAGRRTNIVLTYVFTDENKSEAFMRTCYC